MGPPGLLPPALIRASDTLTLRTVITNLPRDRTAMAQLRAGWRQFDPSTPVYLLTDAGLMTQMTRLLRGRRLLILYLPYQAGSFSSAELSGPPPGRDWSRADKADKVAEALRRSKDHVGPALYHMVEELVSPANIAIMVGFIVAVAIAHATGVAGAAIDVVLIGLAWAMAGYAGVKAIVDFIGAIIDVMDARTDAQIDAAARKFAEAFVALGAAFLARMLAKAKTGGTGTSAPKPKPTPKPASRGSTGRSAGAGGTAAAAANKFATKPNEATFWSGLGSNGAEAAQKYNKANGGKTLEQVMAERGIQMPEWDRNNPASIQAWRDASESFAKGAQGEVRAVLGEVREGSIWNTVELPALKNNPAVTKIIGVDANTGATRILWP
jgi:hypothetical protein